jgi:uroporphyrinogen-III synthase
VHTLAAGSVLLTREAGKNGPLRQKLNTLGIECVELPLVATGGGRDTARLPGVLDQTAFDWVVVTSPEAARVLVDAWHTCASAPSLKLAVLGAGAALQTSCAAMLQEPLCPTRLVRLLARPQENSWHACARCPHSLPFV